MSIDTSKFLTLLDNLDASLKKYGFAPELNEAGDKVTLGENEATAVFASERGALKIRYAGERTEVFEAENTENLAGDAKRIVVSLLPSNADARDLGYVTGEITETLDERFGEKAKVTKKPNVKAPQTVSKAAVKNGSFYDPNTLASKLCLVFPELRAMYKDNIATHGEFLSEEFFVKYGTPRVIEAIKENHPQTMKKLFQTLNEIYEDGTNDTQSLIAVTILGALNNDQILLARCVDYMSETMAPPVIEVNKFLATSAGKKARRLLDNPPPYKPKKQKKPGMLSQMMAAGGNGMPPTV